MQKKEYTIDVGGKPFTAIFSNLTDQAHGSVIVSYCDTAVLATAVMSKNAREGAGYFPLVVDYEERFYASGEILGSRFMRREGKPSDEAILSGRAIDRTIRPLFDHQIRHEVQVVITVLSIGKADPDVLAINAASLAVATSDIPWNGPVSAVRIGKEKKITDSDSDNVYVVNPLETFRDGAGLDIDLLACGKDGNINMIEMAGYETQEDEVVKVFARASEEIEKMQAFQKEIIDDRGREKRVVEIDTLPNEVITTFNELVLPKMSSAIFSGAGKVGINTLADEWREISKEKHPEVNSSLTAHHFEVETDRILHETAVHHDRRPDGRKMNEIREIFAQAGGISNVIHGTGIFYRGGTHILSALTLGGPNDAQRIDGMEVKTEKRFMHHYNFPPFSVGETGRVGGTNRRMTGHGALAEKALFPVIPEIKDFPYTIRIVSESMASNGSTSMASVCGSSVALMDAGVPIKSPVAGIAVGLMMLDASRYKVLTDIQGPEDHFGDMDFKVAGTRDGVTAIQMDVKVDGIPIHILKEALTHARGARIQILDTIKEAIEKPRETLPENAPRVLSMTIKVDQIGLVIGPSGKTVNKIRESTGAEIQIEDDGSVFIIGKNGSAEKAKGMIEELTHEYTVGESFTGVVTRILDFGAFVKIAPSTEGLVHISEIAPFRIENVHDYLAEGEQVPVEIIEVDERSRINLSIKKADPAFAESKQSKSKGYLIDRANPQT